MRKSIFLILVMAFSYVNAQEMIIGKTSTEALKSVPHKEWYNEEYNSFSPNQGIIKELKHLFKKQDFEVEVYFGSWCSDSQREVPHLIKILKEAKFDFDNLRLIGVDRDKQVPDTSEEERARLNITNVPTIIVYQDGRELNRFVEYPQETLEEDLLKIFSKKAYKHSYQF